MLITLIIIATIDTITEGGGRGEQNSPGGCEISLCLFTVTLSLGCDQPQKAEPPLRTEHEHSRGEI